MGGAAVTRLAGLTHRDASWAGLRVVVAGLGVSGFAAADALLERGARVTVLDAGSRHPAPARVQRERATVLEMLGADVRLGPEHVEALPADLAAPAATDLVVTSPGWRPDQPVLAGAAERGLPIWGEVELAWRMRPAEGAAPWLTVTGTNGKTTTVRLLAGMLTAAGLRATAAGNVGTPILEAVLHPQPYDAIAVELSSFQLHYSASLAPLASACLNLAPDHLDWHGSLAAYRDAKAKVYARTQVACVYNAQDQVTEQMVRRAEVQEGCRAVGFTLGVPGLSEVGLVEDVLADRAFVEERTTSAAELGTLADLRPEGAPADSPVPPHLVANALAAAALARAAGA
ncbi:Mur ligase family protein, partial [Ornithinicoccus halotolerans]|uniref:Mur ligase family protein n=1 Tax=Ornithinicoccus halotolerans TaxID=1748220 RepID=UPI00225DFB2C